MDEGKGVRALGVGLNELFSAGMAKFNFTHSAPVGNIGFSMAVAGSNYESEVHTSRDAVHAEYKFPFIPFHGEYMKIVGEGF